MRRSLFYILLLGILTGTVLGIATFGLPLPAEDMAPEPRSFQALILSMGVGLADATLAAGGLAILVLLAIAVADLRRHARNRRP